MNQEPMPGQAKFDVAIFGAGIAGASLAWRLAAKLRVVLIEREDQPGYHSTGRSAAMFMPSYGPPGARALTRASRGFYENPPAGFTDAPLLTPCPTLYVAKPGQQDQLDQLQAELATSCPSLLRLDSAGALALAGCLRPEQTLGALLDRDTFGIDVNALHQGFLRGMRKRGGVSMNRQFLARAQRGPPIGAGAAGAPQSWRLEFDNGDALFASTVVNATGAWGDELASRFGATPVGLTPKRRTAFTFAAPPGLDLKGLPLVAAVDESCYFKADAGRLLGSPANADPSFAHDVLPEDLDVALGIHEIEAMADLVVGRPLSSWAGLRSFVADGELVIGWDPACAGFFWLVGQGGYGIQSAAGASELAASLLLGEPLPQTLAQHGVDPQAMDVLRLRV
jgi:D-arginine dehydrogenase